MQALTVCTGEIVFVDDDVFEWAKSRRWHLCSGYASCSLFGKSVALHRMIMDYPIGHVHHKNGNRLDCRRDNLIVLSPADHRACHPPITGPRGPQQPRTLSSRTVHPPKSHNGYKGVTWNKTMGRWYAKATMDKKVQFLGNHDTPEQAAVVYDAFVLTYRPKGSYTNLIPEDTS